MPFITLGRMVSSEVGPACCSPLACKDESRYLCRRIHARPESILLFVASVLLMITKHATGRIKTLDRVRRVGFFH